MRLEHGLAYPRRTIRQARGEMIAFLKRLLRRKTWLESYLEDQVDPILLINGEEMPNPVGRTSEGEFKLRGIAATATYPSGLSFEELNRARVELGDVVGPGRAIDQEDADGMREALANGDLHGSAAYIRQIDKEREFVSQKKSEATDDLNERVQPIIAMRPLVYKGSTQGTGEDGKLPVIGIQAEE